MQLKRISVLTLYLLSLFCSSGIAADTDSTKSPTANTAPSSTFFVGADLSLLQYIQDHSIEFRQNDSVIDPLQIFHDNGCNIVRLRLFVAPDNTAGQVNTLPYTIKLAKRVKQANMAFMLDLHYSDKWADPAHQQIPAKWQSLSPDNLTDEIAKYTTSVLAAFDHENCYPQIVAVGNEITNGMLWPAAGPLKSDKDWDFFASILNIALKAVRDYPASSTTRTMIHIDCGGDKDRSLWFFNNLKKRNVDFDLIGLSYYPFWHGTLSSLQTNMTSLADTFHKDIMIVETAYNCRGPKDTTLEFPETLQGQKDFLTALIKIVRSAPNNSGRGVIYWAPEWIAGNKWNDTNWNYSLESRALFENDTTPRPALKALTPNPSARVPD